ncbi:MAG: PAS domain S-box protein [Leptolyngbyaceae cyanobacterium SU_3_3]|nr:PAS domain S-box protein [Leptolyngbyaceae cyanobacterium SU_3_3]
MSGASRAGYHPRFAMTIGTIAAIVVFTVLIAQNATLLDYIDRDRKQAEAALRQANDQLEQRVAERTAELSQSNLRLQQEISQRQQAEIILQDSEAGFRSLSDSLPIGVFQTNLEGRCLYTNSRWQQITGLTLLESAGEGWARAIHPEDREAVFSEWNRSIQEVRDFSQEFRFLTPQKEVRWVRARAAALRSATGEVIGYVGTDEDITDRKRAEESFHRSQQKLKAIFDNTFQFMGLLTPEGIVLEANRASLRAIAAAPEDVIGQFFWQTPWWRDSPDAQIQLKQAIQQAATGQICPL